MSDQDNNSNPNSAEHSDEEGTKQTKKIEFTFHIEDYIETFPLNRLAEDECIILASAQQLCVNFLGFIEYVKNVGEALAKIDSFCQWAAGLHSSWTHRIECIHPEQDVEFAHIINNLLHRLCLFISGSGNFLRDLPKEAPIPDAFFVPQRASVIWERHYRGGS